MLEFVLYRSGMGRGDFQWTEDLHCILRLEQDVMEVTAETVGTKVPWDLGSWAQADCSGLWELENESSEHSHLSCTADGTLSVS